MVAYSKDIAPGWQFDDCADCDTLPAAFGEPGGEYRSPMLDEPDWFDPDNPDTWRFAGFYPMSVERLVDSTRTVTVTEGLGHGGTIGRARHATREIRVRGVLVAADLCSLDVGFEWLKKALEGDPCAGCSGSDLCYLTCCPEIVDGVVDQSAEPVDHEVSLTVGWAADNGTWVGGRFRPQDTPSAATGPVLDPPCDEVTYLWTVAPEDATVARFALLGQDGTIHGDTGPVVLRRVNYVRNPTFRRDIGYWSPGGGVTLTKLGDVDAARVTVGEDRPSGVVIATAEGTTAEPGTTWSARVTATAPSEGAEFFNYAPNPSVFTLDGYTAPGYQLALDTDTPLHGATSGKVSPIDNYQVSVDAEPVGLGLDATANITGQITTAGVPGRIGRFIIGNTLGGYGVNITGGSQYAAGVMVNPSQDATATISVQWVGASGAPTGFPVTATLPVPAGAWTRVQVDGVAPAATTRAVVTVTVDATSGAVTSDDQVLFDEVMVTDGPTPMRPYFDGDTADASWLGVPNQAPSRLILPGSQVCLRVGVSVDGAYTFGPPGTVTPGDTVDLSVDGVAVPAASVVDLVVVTCDTLTPAGRVDLSNALLEQSTVAGTYFDGDTEPPGGYTARWQAAPDRSFSIMDRVMPIETVAPSGSGPVTPTLWAVDGREVTVTRVVARYREPVDPAECAASYIRTIRDVATISGPTILSTHTDCDGAVYEVEFILAAANPYSWQVLDTEFRVTDEGTSGGGGPIIVIPFDGEPGSAACPPVGAASMPISDPDCPLPPPPPRPPIPSACLEPVTQYVRRAVHIPGDVLTTWQEAVPIVSLQVNTGVAVRQARIRFWPNPLGWESLSDLDQCSWCGEFVVSYIPGNSVLTIDGMTERATVTEPGGAERDATHLLYGADGGPMTWPLITCGIPYVMTVDTMPTSTDVLATSMQLAVRS